MITYPYMPEGKELLFASLDHPWMQEARKTADELSTCSWWPVGALVVKDEKILGRNANRGTYRPVCLRYEKQCKTGEGYELCNNICQTQGHAEVGSINDAVVNGNDPSGADLYLFGHWWCCEPCWNHMIQHNINRVFLVENSHILFTREKRTALMEDIMARVAKGETITPKETRWQL